MNNSLRKRTNDILTGVNNSRSFMTKDTTKGRAMRSQHAAACRRVRAKWGRNRLSSLLRMGV